MSHHIANITQKIHWEIHMKVAAFALVRCIRELSRREALYKLFWSRGSFPQWPGIGGIIWLDLGASSGIDEILWHDLGLFSL